MIANELVQLFHRLELVLQNDSKRVQLVSNVCDLDQQANFVIISNFSVSFIKFLITGGRLKAILEFVQLICLLVDLPVLLSKRSGITRTDCSGQDLTILLTENSKKSKNWRRVCVSNPYCLGLLMEHIQER